MIHHTIVSSRPLMAQGLDHMIVSSRPLMAILHHTRVL